MATPNLGQLIPVHSYSPDQGPSEAQNKVLLVLRDPAVTEQRDQASFEFFCMFETDCVPASELCPGVLEFFTPPHTPGVVLFWIAIKKTVRSALETCSTIRYSAALPFYFLPLESGRLCIEVDKFATLEPHRLMDRFRHCLRELDLTGCLLSDISFLASLPKLELLVLDRNLLTSSTHFPSFPKLQSLSVNNNNIRNLPVFILGLEIACPILQYLSMLNNEACPYFRREHFYYNYRIYTLSRLLHLTHLDSHSVTKEERNHAACIRENQNQELGQKK